MPGGDRTGPAGAGAMTGRGLGYCTGARCVAPRVGRLGGAGYGRGYYGCGRGPGRGLGRGFGYNDFSYSDIDDRYIDKEKILKDQVDFLEEELKVAKEQLQNLGNKE